MTREHLTTLWKWACLAGFTYVVGSVITIQGGVDIFGGKFFANADKDGIAVLGYFATIVGSSLMCLSLVVAIVFAWRHGRAWYERVPVLMLEGLRTASIEGRIFQFIVAFTLVLIPIVGIGRSMVVANEGAICEQTAQGAQPIYYPGEHWRLINIPQSENQLRLMTRDTQPGVWGKGVEISWYTPIGFGLMPALVVVLLGTWLFMLFRKPSMPTPSPHSE
ncbi:hypothetical protein FS800_25790 [Agrobacterium vitis]|uniref:hypothetical protein n=1 Tax=Rhizobium/Agrobacterium group TaxID=227290 RepID=UPI0012E7CFAD|nr:MULTISPECIES: hypothetical protein [Rhizobium/Agrobacterium group]MCF1475268.1 hypothetical protein [Allorhizobium ampelinum]MCF1485525.1 hypothetical protein [Allorhizobium ampelinum]MVA73563.1 hypothetical protein [Agrobacterium vitis]NSZ19821.1 hypothetical protein [Agrobacterium vitis]QZO07269.1 hypothetical protein K4831_23810 [Agrobacterium vitis]